MNFNEKIKASFIKAGWYPNRNVKNRYSKVKGINKLPEKIKEFLFEYGDLVLEPYQNLYSDEYDFSVRLLKNQRILFSEWCDVKLYKIGEWQEENNLILCDENLIIYLYDETLTKLGNSFEQGIECLLEINFDNQLCWDFHNKQWIKWD